MAFPAPGRQGICPDPSLRITFSGAPTLGTSGKIQVFAATGKVAAVVDMAATSFSDVIGGTTFNTVRPVYVDGSDVVVHLKSHALAYGQTYYVNVDPGAILGAMGTPFSIGDTTSWRFGTAAAAPADLSSLTVALNGSGDFCSVQGAIDALPSGSASAATIAIDAGVYHEIVHFASKNNVTLNVAYINCTMGSHISPAGWTITGVGGTSQLRFWEYGSVNPSGAAINVSQRVAGSTQISASQAMSMRDKAVVFSGWQPP
jgi:hypothetical protein